MTFNTLDRPDLLNHFLILRYSLLCSLYSAAGNATIKIHTCILLFKFMLTSVVTNIPEISPAYHRKFVSS